MSYSPYPRSERIEPSSIATSGRNLTIALSVWPLVLAVLGNSWYFSKFVTGSHALSQGSDGDVFRQLIFGFSYLLAGLSFAKNANRLLPIFLKQPLHLLLLGLALSSVFWSDAPGKVLVNLVHLVGALLIGCVSGALLTETPVRFFRALGLLFGITLVVSIALASLLPSYGQMLIDERSRWVGVGTHPNQLGVSGTVSVWIALSLYQIRSGFRDTLLAGVLLFLGLIAVIGANSITSLLGVIAILVWSLFMRTAVTGGTALIRMTLVLFATTVAIVSLAVAAPELLRLDAVFGVFGRSGNLTGRTDLWALAIEAITQRPLLGWGFDSNVSVSRAVGLQFGQFHNGYLDLAVRGGLLGLMLVIGMAVHGLIRGLQVWEKSRYLALTSLSMLLFILVHNVTEASFARPTHQLWLFFVVGTTALSIKSGAHPRLRQRSI